MGICVLINSYPIPDIPVNIETSYIPFRLDSIYRCPLLIGIIDVAISFTSLDKGTQPFVVCDG